MIEEGVRNGDSTRRISKAIGVSASTVTREVRANRTVRDTRSRPGTKASPRCAHYGECGIQTRPKSSDCVQSCPNASRLPMCSTVR